MNPGNKAVVSIISVNIRGVGSPQSSSSPALRAKFKLFCHSPPSQINSVPARLVTELIQLSPSFRAVLSCSKHEMFTEGDAVPTPYMIALAPSLAATRSFASGPAPRALLLCPYRHTELHRHVRSVLPLPHRRDHHQPATS